MQYWKKLLEIEKRNKKIISLRNKKWTLKKIALKYGISKQRVFAILKENEEFSEK
jgi:DNA-directed RNA polymerase specialized sigma subunit